MSARDRRRTRFCSAIASPTAPTSVTRTRALSLADNLASETLGDEETYIVSAAARVRPRLQPIAPQIEELRLALPYNFALEDYQQILGDVATRIAPALGWKGRADAANH